MIFTFLTVGSMNNFIKRVDFSRAALKFSFIYKGI